MDGKDRMTEIGCRKGQVPVEVPDYRGHSRWEAWDLWLGTKPQLEFCFPFVNLLFVWTTNGTQMQWLKTDLGLADNSPRLVRKVARLQVASLTRVHKQL